MYYILVALIVSAISFTVGYRMGRTDGCSDALLGLDAVLFKDTEVWDRIQRQLHADAWSHDHPEDQ